jgi:hypothetical protein
MKKDEGNRRTFLKSLLAGSAVAVGVAAGTGTARAGHAKISSPGSNETLYRETEEFKRYYQSLRS